MPTPAASRSYSPDTNDLPRLAEFGSCFLRITTVQSGFIIAAKLRTQLHENEGLSAVPLQPDLLSVLEEAKSLTAKCIEASETDIKGYMLLHTASTEIDALKQKRGEHETPQLIMKAAKDAVSWSLPVFEGKAAQYWAQDGPKSEKLPQIPQMTLGAADLINEGWNLMARSYHCMAYRLYC